MKKHIFSGILAGIIAGVSGIIYSVLYQKTLFVDFNQVINPYSIVGVSILSCVLMAFIYGLLDRFNKNRLRGLVNVFIVLISFVSVLGPISISLPLELDFPELFPGLAIPMHFFPALIFFGLQPFFSKPHSNEQ